MATNQVFAYTEAKVITAAATAPTTPSSGDPVLIGQIPGVALTDETSAGLVTAATDGTWLLSVKGENQSGNSAVAVGDILYYEAGQTPPVNKDATNGVRFGYAVGSEDGSDVTTTLIASGSTATIRVKVGY